MVTYLLSEGLRDRRHAADRNYWDAYFAEILAQLGIQTRAAEVWTGFPGIADRLGATDVLLTGETCPAELSPAALDALAKWLGNGGILIGSGSTGLDDFFGIEEDGWLDQPSETEPAAYLDFADGAIVRGIRAPSGQGVATPLFSRVRRVRCAGARTMASLRARDGGALPCPAITENRYGKGIAYYFAFSLPRAVWLLHQGVRVDPAGSEINGTLYCKTNNLCVLGRHRSDIPYADELLLILQKMIALKPVPFIHQLPPEEGRTPDGLFFWGGDDEGIVGTQVAASDWLKGQGLPYHVNVLWLPGGQFNLSPEEKAHIEANGHEVSLHYNFIDENKPPFPFNREDIGSQNADYRKRFGAVPVSSVMHYTLWQGWHEPAQWLAECGGMADNSFYSYQHHDAIPAYPFGTAFPFFFYGDGTQGNRRINFIEQPISGFEFGYGHLAQKPEDAAIDREAIRRGVETTAHYGACLNAFYHTYRIRDWAGAKLSIVETLRCIEERGLRIRHLGNDQLTRWWFSRDATKVTAIPAQSGAKQWRVATDWPEGVILKLPSTSSSSEAFRVNGRRVSHETHVKFGLRWSYVFIARGESVVERMAN